LSDLHSNDRALVDEVMGLLRGQDELGQGAHIVRALELVAQEADARISSQFEILGGLGSTIELSGYSYSAFLTVYRFLLAKAIYHRYFANANGTWATFMYSKKLLPTEICMNTELDIAEVNLVLGDLSYSKKCNRLPPMYFGIIDHEDLPDYVMIPERFIGSDGPAQWLRVQAARSPEQFLRNVSQELGSNFVELVASRLRDAGFLVGTNVSLKCVSAELPDIDLLVISREATLGYYVIACEVKATLPATWAKDYLRVLGAGGLPKAFTQVRSVLAALGTDNGVDFLVDHILSLDKNPIREGLILVQGLIVTPQNSGMFFDEMSKRIRVIDYHTLSLLLSRSDGDLLYILKTMDALRDLFDVEAEKLSVNVGGFSATYDAVAYDAASGPDFLVDFPTVSWKSAGRDVEVAEEFYREGGSPFDVLRHLKLHRNMDRPQ